MINPSPPPAASLVILSLSLSLSLPHTRFTCIYFTRRSTCADGFSTSTVTWWWMSNWTTRLGSSCSLCCLGWLRMYSVKRRQYLAITWLLRSFRWCLLSDVYYCLCIGHYLCTDRCLCFGDIILAITPLLSVDCRHWLYLGSKLTFAFTCLSISGMNCCKFSHHSGNGRSLSKSGRYALYTNTLAIGLKWILYK